VSPPAHNVFFYAVINLIMHGAILPTLTPTLSLWVNKIPSIFHLSVTALILFVSQGLSFYSSFFDLASFFTSTNPEWLNLYSFKCRHRL